MWPTGITQTPEVVLDVDALTRNLETMASVAQQRGQGLRPHAKTHKIPEVAALQRRSGALGLTVATIGEAEVFAAHGADDILIAYPLWVRDADADRLRRLVETCRITVGVDSAAGASNLASRLGPGARELDVWLEVDSGHHRSGVRPDDATAVGVSVVDEGLNLTGVFTFPGHGYAPNSFAAAAVQEAEALVDVAARLVDHGIAIAHRSGGSTPTSSVDTGEALTEIRPGVYAFGDSQQLELGRMAESDIALAVAATVVSRSEGGDGVPRRVVVDAGSKVLGSDRPPWLDGWGRIAGVDGARVTVLSEHHATATWPADIPLPPCGEVVYVIPNHVCLTMNLVDSVAVASGGAVVDRWTVAARGRNR